MRAAKQFLTSAVLCVAVAASAQAQKTTDQGTGRGGSQHVKSEWTIGGAHVAIAYGRPTLKGRGEAAMMPAGKPWRTGADAATVLTTDKALTFGKVVLQPGSYTLNTQPGASAWELIFGNLEKEGQWGVPYQPALEIARTPMTVRKLTAPVEQLTIKVDHVGRGPALVMEWGTVSVSAPFAIAK